VEQVQVFLNRNNLKAVIRSHESCQDGFENLIDKVITVWSVADYCALNKNLAAILIVKVYYFIMFIQKKNGELVTKVL
jgi:hypothetical protein